MTPNFWDYIFVIWVKLYNTRPDRWASPASILGTVNAIGLNTLPFKVTETHAYHNTDLIMEPQLKAQWATLNNTWHWGCSYLFKPARLRSTHFYRSYCLNLSTKRATITAIVKCKDPLESPRTANCRLKIVPWTVGPEGPMFQWIEDPRF